MKGIKMLIFVMMMYDVLCEVWKGVIYSFLGNSPASEF